MLKQDEANHLLKIEKHFMNSDSIKMPIQGERITLPLQDDAKRLHFLLDVSRRGSFSLQKYTLNDRFRISIVLARVDINPPPHENPDGVKIEGDHIHLFREGFADKWAIKLCDFDTYDFCSCNNIIEYFQAFCGFLNIKNLPDIQDVI